MANDLNMVALIGNLTRDAEVSYTKSNSAVAKLSIASNRSVKRGDKWESEAGYFDVTLFGKQAEALKPYLLKGRKIAVSGELRQDRWEKDGQKFSKVYVAAESIQLLGGERGGKQEPQGSSYPTSDEFPQDVPF